MQTAFGFSKIGNLGFGHQTSLHMTFLAALNAARRTLLSNTLFTQIRCRLMQTESVHQPIFAHSAHAHVALLPFKGVCFIVVALQFLVFPRGVAYPSALALTQCTQALKPTFDPWCVSLQ